MDTKVYALFGLLLMSAAAFAGGCRTKRPRQALTEKQKYARRVEHCWRAGDKKQCENSYKVRREKHYQCEWRD